MNRSIVARSPLACLFHQRLTRLCLLLLCLGLLFPAVASAQGDDPGAMGDAAEDLGEVISESTSVSGQGDPGNSERVSQTVRIIRTEDGRIITERTTTRLQETTSTTREETQTVREEAVPEPRPVAERPVRRVAILVKNRAGELFDDKVEALEDLVVARIDGLGFSVVSREDFVNAVSTFAERGGGDANRGEEEGLGSRVDRILSDNTSATALTRAMGADTLFIASITSFGQDRKQFDDPALGVRADLLISTLRVSYKVVAAGDGGSLVAGSVEVQDKANQTDNLSTSSSDLLNRLLDDAATELAAKLDAQVERGEVREALTVPEGQVAFTVVCGMQDLSIPDITRDDAGEYIVTGNRYRLEPMDVTVQRNGIAIGTAPGELAAPPGLCRIRLTRAGFEPWEEHVNITDGFTLRVPMQLTPEGYARWRQNIEFLQALKNEATLTAAEAERLRGIADAMREFGIGYYRTRGNREGDINIQIDRDSQTDPRPTRRTPGAQEPRSDAQPTRPAPEGSANAADPLSPITPSNDAAPDQTTDPAADLAAQPIETAEAEPAPASRSFWESVGLARSRR